jgi:N-acetylneuraminic acid mutarotase
LGGYPATKLEPKILEKMKGHWTIKENIWKPSVRIGSALTLCAGNRLYLFGGYNKMATSDLYYIDPKKAEWITV